MTDQHQSHLSWEDSAQLNDEEFLDVVGELFVNYDQQLEHVAHHQPFANSYFESATAPLIDEFTMRYTLQELHVAEQQRLTDQERGELFGLYHELTTSLRDFPFEQDGVEARCALSVLAPQVVDITKRLACNNEGGAGQTIIMLLRSLAELELSIETEHGESAARRVAQLVEFAHFLRRQPHKQQVRASFEMFDHVVAQRSYGFGDITEQDREATEQLHDGFVTAYTDTQRLLETMSDTSPFHFDELFHSIANTYSHMDAFLQHHLHAERASGWPFTYDT